MSLGGGILNGTLFGGSLIPSNSSILLGRTSTSTPSSSSTTPRPSSPPSIGGGLTNLTGLMPQLTSTIFTTIVPPQQCPPIGVKEGFYDENIIVSTRRRDVGTTVEVTCAQNTHMRGPHFLQCLPQGIWNGSEPHCDREFPLNLGLPTSTLILIGVLAAASFLIICTVIVLICRFTCCNDRNKGSRRSSMQLQDGSDATSADPYYVSDLRPRSLGEASSVTYAKPEVHSSFINPAFYEQSYDKWREREAHAHDAYSLEHHYDRPWQFSQRVQKQMDSPDLRWSSVSLRAHDNYDYGRFGRIPRASVTEPPADSETLTSF